MLRVENIAVSYGNIAALKGISLHVERGEIITLLGANGAGKTTTLNSIMGLYPPSSGKVYCEEQDITKTDVKKKVQSGLILAPEGRQIFQKFTVMDNLLMGGYLRKPDEIEKSLKTVFELFPILEQRISQVSGTLSGGEQQMLCIGRAMMGNPRLLLLDEPSLGLAPLIVKEIFNLILRIRDFGCTILLVEQNARMALKFSDRAYVLETGRIVLEGAARDLLHSDTVRRAYLGGL